MLVSVSLVSEVYIALTLTLTLTLKMFLISLTLVRSSLAIRNLSLVDALKVTQKVPSVDVGYSGCTVIPMHLFDRCSDRDNGRRKVFIVSVTCNI